MYSLGAAERAYRSCGEKTSTTTLDLPDAVKGYITAAVSKLDAAAEDDYCAALPIVAEVCKCASADLCNAALATSADSLLATTGLAAATMTSLLL